MEISTGDRNLGLDENILPSVALEKRPLIFRAIVET
jgi:hypothetical protein